MIEATCILSVYVKFGYADQAHMPCKLKQCLKQCIYYLICAVLALGHWRSWGIGIDIVYTAQISLYYWAIFLSMPIE